MYHLDTDTVIEILHGDANVTRRLVVATPDVSISSIVLAELIYGAAAAAKPLAARQRLDRFLSSLDIVPFNSAASEAYGRIRLELQQVGLPIGDMDMLIAAVALANQVTLVTHNTKHFARVKGLRLEDWIPDAT
jgi:tRNA(fMet)-specific endonuclease VapC